MKPEILTGIWNYGGSAAPTPLGSASLKGGRATESQTRKINL